MQEFLGKHQKCSKLITSCEIAIKNCFPSNHHLVISLAIFTVHCWKCNKSLYMHVIVNHNKIGQNRSYGVQNLSCNISRGQQFLWRRLNIGPFTYIQENHFIILKYKNWKQKKIVLRTSKRKGKKSIPHTNVWVAVTEISKGTTCDGEINRSIIWYRNSVLYIWT